MDIETLNNRLQDIEKALQQTLSNYNMLEGGKQEVLHWLAQLQVKEHEEKLKKGNSINKNKPKKQDDSPDLQEAA